MSGRLRRVAAWFKAEEASALHVHCLAHCLNLCLQDASQMCSSICDALELVMDIVKIIKFLPKRTTLFDKIKSQLFPESHNLKPLCPTRWTVRTAAISAVLENYEALISTIEEVHSTGHDEYAIEGKWLFEAVSGF